MTAALFGWSGADAATVLLLNGEEVQGELLGVEPSELTLRVGDGLVHIELRQVRDVLLAGGESVWERRVRAALRESRNAARRRRSEELARELARAASTGEIVGEQQQAESVGSAARRIDVPAEQPALSFSGRFRDERSGVALRFPLGWEARRVDEGYFTFRDPRPDADGIWRFNLTLFDRATQPYDVVAVTLRRQLRSLAHYRVERRETVQLGFFLGEHTVGRYEHEGTVIRHDVFTIETRRHVAVFMFFVPGLADTEGEVPEIAAVLRSAQFSR